MERKYIKKRMVEIFNDYAMDKDESEFVIDMYFVKKNGENQHKTLCWKLPTEDESDEIKVFCVADLKEKDALELLFDHLPDVFKEFAKAKILSQYEKRRK